MPNLVVPIFESGIYEEGVYCGYSTDKIDRLDLKNKRIYLRSGVTEYHPVDDIYKTIRFIRLTDVSLRNMQIPVSAGGNVNKGGGKATPRYAIFNHGWKIVPQDANHTLYVKGEQITDDGQSGPACIDTSLLSVDTRVIIQYEPPAAEIIVQVAQLTQIEHASFDGKVVINQATGAAGTDYPIGTDTNPVNNWTDAKAIADARGFTDFYIVGNFTTGATDNLTNYSFYGQGATLNVTKTLVTLTDGCITTNSHWYNCKIQGKQGGESHYDDCIIGNLTNAHCRYINCGFVGPVQFASAIGSTHTTYLKDCYTGHTGCTIDKNGSQLKQVYDNFSGKLTFINGTNAGSTIYMYDMHGTVTLDPTSTAGTYQFFGGSPDITNNSTSTVLISDAMGKVIWQSPVPNTPVANSFGELVSKKLLTVVKFLGLK